MHFAGKIFNFIKKTTFISLIIIFSFCKNSFAGISLIRDSETEKFLRSLSNPIFKVANLNSKNIDIYIVNDQSINAFVTGGQNIFINTGLIRKYKTPDSLIGVIAHEVGHIAGGHLVIAKDNMEASTGALLLSYLLGIGAAVGGAPDAGIALILGGSQTAQRLQARYTRGQEEAADQYAVKYLDEMQYPADGLIELFEFLDAGLIGYRDQIDEYILSHPLSRKRINLIKHRANKSHSNKKINAKLQKEMNFIQAKLEGFLDDPQIILRKYKNKHDQLANYAKSIALFRQGQIPQAIKLINKVIAKNPKNGFLYEVKGQIYYESGDVQNAILTYNKAIKLLNFKDSALIKQSFAAAILSLKTTDQDLVKLAINNLNQAKMIEKQNPSIFKSLSLAYSKINDEARSFLSLAEYNCLIGKKTKCRKYAAKAKEKFKASDKLELLQIEDLIEISKIGEKDQPKEKDDE